MRSERTLNISGIAKKLVERANTCWNKINYTIKRNIVLTIVVIGVARPEVIMLSAASCPTVWFNNKIRSIQNYD